MASELKIKWVKSTIGRREKHRKTIEALGFKKLNQVLIKKNDPAIRGMIKQVSYLLQVEEI